MVRLVLVFNVVLNDRVGWVGRVCGNERKAYLGLLLRINVVNAVNGLYFFAVPYPISVDRAESAHAQRTDRVHESHWFRSCSWKKLSRSNESLRTQNVCLQRRQEEKTEMGYTHVVLRSHLVRERKTSERDTGPKSARTYVTDGVVGASELRVLAGGVVVTMCGDLDHEKEGYCREGSHRVAVGKVVVSSALATCNLDGPRSPLSIL